jgi:uncharacterized alkaline shock family protein YloU
LNRLTVRLLEAGTGTGTTELLGLAAAVVGNEEGSVELDESLLQEVLGVLIDELLVVGDESLGNGLSDSVNLRNMTTAIYAHTNVYIGELVEANDEERLVDLCCLSQYGVSKSRHRISHNAGRRLRIIP